MFEWQRDWARTETYDGCMEILQAHSASVLACATRRAILGEHARRSRLGLS
jgi:hypothetical protein